MGELVNLEKLNHKQKVNYIKNLLFSHDINEALDIIISKEKKDLELTHIIIDCLGEKDIINKIKDHLFLTDNDYTITYVYSKIVGILYFYNKTRLINNLFKGLDEDTIRKIAYYGYKNKLEVSNSMVFNKYCAKYKDEALKSLALSEEETIEFDLESKNYNKLSKTNKKPILIGILSFLLVLIIVLSTFLIRRYNKFSKTYDKRIVPGVYLNGVSLKGKKLDELDEYLLEEKKKIESGTLIITNVNGEYRFTYKEVGITVDTDAVNKEIKDYVSKLNIVDKIKLSNGLITKKKFRLEGSFTDDSINNFMSILKTKINLSKEDGTIKTNEKHEVYYSEGHNGFTLDENLMIISLKKQFREIEAETKVQAEGEIVEKSGDDSLKTINKKISSYTTYFANSGNRGHNISHASARLNGTLLMPGETFSYLKAVGPYNGSNGYRPAPVYVAGQLSVANGGGVCQLASTTYMAQLIAGLETVYRTNHTYAPTYVPLGLDATVSGTAPNYLFKNQYNYPVYISSYVTGNYVHVDIWSNENYADGKTFEPYSVRKGTGYASYLRVKKDGKVLETKYLGMSYYKTH